MDMNTINSPGAPCRPSVLEIPPPGWCVHAVAWTSGIVIGEVAAPCAAPDLLGGDTACILAFVKAVVMFVVT